MQSNKPSSSKAQSQKSNLWLTLLIGVAAIAGVAIFYGSYFNNRGIEQTAEQQLVALRAKDISKAYYDFTSSDFQAETCT